MAYLQFAPRRAFVAARVLVDDPDDLPKVFTVIESLSLDTLERIARRMRASASGRRLMASRPDIVQKLADREGLARLPEGSLGHAYLAFVEREKISADGIREAARAGMAHAADMPPPLAFIHARMRDTHDLWHAATGYSGDVLGELSLLAFTLTQTWNPGVALIILVGMTKTLGFADGPSVRRTIYDGFRRGRKAKWLPEQDWESLLALPVEEVRRRLSLEAPPVYTEIRSAEIKMRAAA
jgi:ubiquinone biosynthesis protein COQ4